jgi:hypothetical protein
LHEQVIAGRLSAHAAAIEAGFRKRMVQIPVGDAEAAVRTIKKHFDVKEILELLNQKETDNANSPPAA